MKSLIVVAAYDERLSADLCGESLKRAGYKGEVVVLRKRPDTLTPLYAAALATASLASLPELKGKLEGVDAVLVVDPLTVFQSDPTELLENIANSEQVWALAGSRRMINVADRLGLSVADRERVGTRREFKLRCAAYPTATGGASSALKHLAELLEKYPTENPSVLLCRAAAAYGEHFDYLPFEQFDRFRAYEGPAACFDRAEDAKTWLAGLPAAVSAPVAPAKVTKVDKVPAKAEAKA